MAILAEKWSKANISYSLSSLQALKSQKLNNPIVSNILHMCHYLSGHKEIVFFAGYPAILEWRAMNGLMFWPRLPWIRQNSFIIYHILISSTTSLYTLMTFCKVNGTSMSPTNYSRYNQSLSDLSHQWNAEEMTLSCRIPASLDHRDSRPRSPGRGETVGWLPRFNTPVLCA